MTLRKQNVTPTCPKNKLKLKFFLAPQDHGKSILNDLPIMFPVNQSINQLFIYPCSI